jgi:hypothetical protein
MKRGDYVRTWFDTGAMGATVLYGRVVKAGPRTYTVLWESGLRNRIVRENSYITPISDREQPEAARVMARAEAKS